MHITTVTKKLLKFVSIFYKVRNKFPVECLNKIYYAFVHPHLLYGIEIYGNTYKTHLDMLYTLNNKIIRVLFSLDYTFPSRNLYFKVDSLPLVYLHELQLLYFVKKCLHFKTLLPKLFWSRFTFINCIHGHSTRCYDIRLFMPRVRNNYGKRQSAYKCAVLWNNLPHDLKVVASFPAFIDKTKSFYSSKYDNI